MFNLVLISSPLMVVVLAWFLTFYLSGIWFYIACFVSFVLTLAVAFLYYVFSSFRVQ